MDLQPTTCQLHYVAHGYIMLLAVYTFRIYSQDICFIGGLSVYMTSTSSSLMVSSFVLCGLPFLAGLYYEGFILEIFSMGYVNMFSFFYCLCLRV